jgi:hypothetical protein
MDVISVLWRKSSHSGGNGGGCLEAGAHSDGDRVLVRDTQDRTGPVLGFGLAAWTAFAERLKASG